MGVVMNTLYNLGEHLTLVGFTIHNDTFDHHIDVTIGSRQYPKLFSSIRRDFHQYRIEPIIGVMEVIEITTNLQGQAIYHGRIIQHAINHINLPAGTLCQSGAIPTADTLQRNSVWKTSGVVSELMELQYAKKLAKRAKRSRSDDIGILLAHFNKIEDKLILR